MITEHLASVIRKSSTKCHTGLLPSEWPLDSSSASTPSLTSLLVFAACTSPFALSSAVRVSLRSQCRGLISARCKRRKRTPQDGCIFFRSFVVGPCALRGIPMYFLCTDLCCVLHGAFGCRWGADVACGHAKHNSEGPRTQALNAGAQMGGLTRAPCAHRSLGAQMCCLPRTAGGNGSVDTNDIRACSRGSSCCSTAP